MWLRFVALALVGFCCAAPPVGAQTEGAAATAVRFADGIRAFHEGRDEEALPLLQACARIPAFRFRGSVQVGELYLLRGDVPGGIEWLEGAAEVVKSDRVRPPCRRLEPRQPRQRRRPTKATGTTTKTARDERAGKDRHQHIRA